MRPARTARMIPVLIVVCFLIFPAHAQYSGGSGTAGDPYRIATAADLIALGETPDDYDKHFILTADIDLDPNLPGRRVFDSAVLARDTDDVESGFQGASFAGVFDGRGHTIAHLAIAGDLYLGLFGQLASGAEVRDLGLVDVNITNSRSLIGGLVGVNNGSIVRSYSAGEFSGKTLVGGLVGINNGSVAMSYSIGEVSGDHVGGLVGWNTGTILESHSVSAVHGKIDAGGLVGQNRDAGSIAGSYSTGVVSGDVKVGGLVGHNDDTSSISNSYSTGAVNGMVTTGGLVGSNDGSIIACYSTGEPTGGLIVGGLVGGSLFGSVTSSFWDVDASGLVSSQGGAGKTTTEMQTANTFLDAGWDFMGETVNGPNDIWKISEGLDYPRLWWQKYGGGTGEPNDPYLIYTAEHLNALGAEPNDYDKHFKLMADIDLDPNLPFDGPVIDVFRGIFDGNDNTISNLRVMGEGPLGLFGQLTPEACVKNLGVVDVNITGWWGNCVGGLVGQNNGSITSSYCTGSVNGIDHVGGLVGSNNLGSITSNYSTGSVSGEDDRIGGLVGFNNLGSITSSYSSASVSGDCEVGGLVGAFSGGGITSSYSTGSVVGSVNDDRVGGLVGYNYRSGNIAASFWDIETSGQTKSDGGTGKTTGEMWMASTFLNAGWDFMGETANGAEDIWWIDEGHAYPRLWWEPPTGYPDDAVRVHRFWSPALDVYFYTSDDGEKDEFVADSSGLWAYQGIAYYAYAHASEPGLVPVHRFYAEGLQRYFYTDSEAEKTKLMENYSHVWTYEGIAFYVFEGGQQPADAAPVYRFWSPTSNSHFYTADEEEKHLFIADHSDVWVYEGIAWYAYKP